jgi:hypothetical protein
MLASTVHGIDVGEMMRLLAGQLVGFIRRGLTLGVASYDMLEAVTDGDTNLEHWRAMDGGALDKRIMALFA